MDDAANDNQTAFDAFMSGYWHQMADELYNTFDDALADFHATEGGQKYRQLINELRVLHDNGRFPTRATIRSAYRNQFWKKYHRIVVQEDLKLAAIEWSRCS